MEIIDSERERERERKSTVHNWSIRIVVNDRLGMRERERERGRVYLI